jgi:hypothetical protein
VLLEDIVNLHVIFGKAEERRVDKERRRRRRRRRGSSEVLICSSIAQIGTLMLSS